MSEIAVFIEADASITFLKSPLTAGFRLGPTVTRRYSSVEPDNVILRGAFHILRLLFGETGAVSDFTRSWRCLWRANIKGGPILPERWTNRQDAINAEIAYFNINGVNL